MPRQSRPDSRRRPASKPTARERVGRRAHAEATDQVPSARSAGLTTRAAVLGLVLCALVVSAALPLRELLDQRGQIAELQEEQAARQARVAALETERKLLDDPDYVAGLARERLHFVKPGERQYVLKVEPTPAPAPVEGTAITPVGDEAPWYSQLWGTVASSDRPQGVMTPAPTPTPR